MIVKVATVEVHKFLDNAKEFLFKEAEKGISRSMGEIPDYMWDFVCSKVTDVRYNTHFSGLYEIAGTIAECDTEQKEVKPECPIPLDDPGHILREGRYYRYGRVKLCRDNRRSERIYSRDAGTHRPEQGSGRNR